MSLDSKELAAKRAEAQRLDVSLQVGKQGVTEATVAELDRQLKAKRLVKVRLLPSASGGGMDPDQAQALAEAAGAQLVEVRGRTAVLWRP